MTAPTIADSPLDERSRTEILSSEAVAFLAELHGRFDARRLELLAARKERRAQVAAGAELDFLPETREIREDSSWRTAPPRADYLDRRVEITGPTDRKLVINALNSGAKGFMADFEDANSPTWANQVSGHGNLIDAIEGTITYESSDGRHYELAEQTAIVLVRPRGLHLPERHISFAGAAGSGSLVDFGLFAFHGAPRLAAKGLGSYLYLPKMEHHLEARLWDDVLAFAEDSLGLARGQFRATVLIETLPAAFQMEEMLWELREHSYGMNAGRWDYIFSAIKTFRERPDAVLPDRAEVEDDRPLHARLHRAPGPNLPRPRHLRDGRDGGADPEPHRRRGQRAGDRRGPRRQGAGGPATASTAPGSPTPTWWAWPPRRSTPCWASALTRSSAFATTSSLTPPPSSISPRPRAR